MLDKLTYSEWAGYGYVGFPGYGNLPAWAYNPPVRHYQSLSAMAEGSQAGLISEMFSPVVLQRIEDNPSLVSGAPTMTMQDLFDWMHASVYAELGPRRAVRISPMRRALQADYERTLIGLTSAPAAGVPDDAQALARADLARLVDEANGALQVHSLDGVTRAHLTLLRARAQQALKI